MTAVAVTVAGCSHHHRAAPARTSAAPVPAPACAVVGVAYVDVVRRHHVTFERVVRDDAPRRDIVGTGAALAFAKGTGGHDSLGPYAKAVDYLADRWAGHDVGPPSAAVLASARRLDADLARGLCAGFRTGS